MATDARHRVSSVLVAGFLLFSLLAPLATAQPWPVCRNGSKYKVGSTYQDNLGLLSASLPTNTSRSRVLFATEIIGAVPDAVYALALCRGDSNASTCESCIASAYQAALQLCPYNKDAAVYLDDCNLRFSNENFLATTDNGNLATLVDPQSVSSSAEAFDAAVGVLLNATSDYAAANSFRRFATGEEASRTSNFTIYGLAQCTPDLSPADCRSCLRIIIALTPQYLSGKQGGRICGVRCNFRYKLNNKFFNGGPSLQLQTQLWPPLASAPKNGTSTATLGGE
jgi:hypothetical protein